MLPGFTGLVACVCACVADSRSSSRDVAVDDEKEGVGGVFERGDHFVLLVHHRRRMLPQLIRHHAPSLLSAPSSGQPTNLPTYLASKLPQRP
eukprot:3500067-Rhodomonas_salina.3